MSERPRRKQARKRDDLYVYDSDLFAEVSDTRAAPATKRRKRATSTAAAAATALQDDSDRDSDADINTSDQKDEEEDEDDEEEECMDLDADLSESARDNVYQMTISNLGDKTKRDYGVVIAVLERWAAAGGFKEGTNPAKLDLLGTMPRNKVANLLFRFFQWWIDGRPGDPLAGGPEVQNEELGRSGAMKVHSALQKMLEGCCCKANTDNWFLRDVNPYKGLYKKYCSKTRDKQLVAAAAASEAGLSRAVHVSFGRETYLLACRRLVASADHVDVMTLSMFTSQVSMVARGDDLRSRRLPDLSTRMMACVGPSMAIAITVLQPPGTGKTLITRPAFKGILRNKLPELCSVGALARWLVVRFKLQSEPIPKPGSKAWKKFFLWCGRAGEEMSRNYHGKLMAQLFADLGVVTAKLTHEMRIFAAQLMYEMGVSLEVIQRIGAWLLDPFGTAYIVPGFTAEALLALALWAGAAQKDFTGYWAERFHAAVPEELVQLLMPGLAALEKAVADLKAAGKPSAVLENLVKLLRMLAVVAVQDALELADAYPANPVHSMLLANDRFKLLLESYKLAKWAGQFEHQRPLGVKDAVKQLLEKQTQELKQHLSRALGPAGSSTSSSTGLNWQGFEKLQQAAQEDEQQQQKHALTLEEVVANLQKVAAGKVKPAPELAQRIQQQEVAVTDAQLAAELDSSSNDADDAGTAQTAEPAAANPAAGAASTAPVQAAAAAPEDSPASPPTVSTDDAAAAAEAEAAAEATAGVAAAPDDPAAAAAAAEAEAEVAATPDVQLHMTVEMPDEEFSTPSGKKYSSSMLSKRTAETLTPGGTHFQAFFTGMQQQQQQQQQQPQQQQQQQQQQATFLQVAADQERAMVQRQQPQPQQQQGLYSAPSPVILQQLAQLTQMLVHDQQQAQSAQQVQQQQHTSGMQPQLQLQLQLAAVQQQQRQQQLVLQQVLNLLQRMHGTGQAQQQQQQQQQDEQLLDLQQRSISIQQAMGGSDPVANIWQPLISSHPELNAVLGPASCGYSSTAGTAGNSALLLAALESREKRHTAQVVQGVMAALAAGGLVGAAGAQPTAAAAAGEGVPGAVAAAATRYLDTAGIAAAAAAAGPGSSSAAAAGSSSQQLTAAQPSVKAKGQAAKIGFPDLSKHGSIEELATWYYVDHLADTGKTPQQLETAGADNGYMWRGGQKHRPQRWAEYVQLLRAIEAARDRLTDEARQASQQPHRVPTVGPVEAARELDAQRVLLQLSVCEYREFLNHTGKGYRKGKANAAALPADKWGQLPAHLQAELQEAQQAAAD